MRYRLDYGFLKLEFRELYTKIQEIEEEEDLEKSYKKIISLLQDILTIICVKNSLFYHRDAYISDSIKVLANDEIIPYEVMCTLSNFIDDISYLKDINSKLKKSSQNISLEDKFPALYEVLVWLVINCGEEDYSLFYDKLNEGEKAVFNKYLYKKIFSKEEKILRKEEEIEDEIIYSMDSDEFDLNLDIDLDDVELEETFQEELSEEDEPGSAYLLEGEIHYLGKGVEKNYFKAREFFEKSAEEGNEDAQAYLALFYEKGLGGARDVDRAIYWYKKSALKGNSFSQYSLGYIYFSGENVEKNLEYAFQWYKTAAENGFAPAQYALSYLYKNGEGCGKNIFKAYYWLEESAENDFEDSYYVLGQSYLEGSYVETDYKKAFFYLSKGANKGDKNCIESLGDMYYWGFEVDEDKEKAFKLYNKSIEKGNTNLYYKLGQMIEDEGNREKAMEYFLKGHDSGDLRATQKLGIVYYNGDGVKKDIDKALEYMKIAASTGEHHALYVLGVANLEKDRLLGIDYLKNAYKNGSALAAEALASEYLVDVFNEKEINEKELLEYIDIAMENDIGEAFYYYGLLYNNGIGVKKSNEEAFKYFKIAAERGCEKAMIKLGNWYKHGIYVNASAKDAIKWYKRAAEEYNTEAILNIIEIYEKGIGIKRDFDKAFKAAKLLREANVVEGNLKLAYYYMVGIGTEIDLEKTTIYIQDTMELDERKTLNFLGEIAERHMLGFSDEDAIEFYLRSVQLGYVKAYANLEYILYKGNKDINIYSEYFEAIKNKRNNIEQGKSIYVKGKKLVEKGKFRLDNNLIEIGIREIEKSIALGFYPGIIDILSYYESLEKTSDNLIHLYKTKQKLIYYNLI
ncbi:sel1 repeat family protein [Clostridium septicum]|uniref:tetratricopeptide repeat protein n=1 Tax=Clostridium septicum TaxID=1504 RepID=UPI003216ACDE